MLEAPPHGHAKQSPTIPESSLPDTFDWSDVDGRSYLLPSWNQHIPTYCGSCYVHAALSVVQDRIKVAKGGRPPDVMLARQSFVNCGEAHGFGKGCGGGNAPDVYNFMHEVGLPDETCNAYVAKGSDTCDAEAMCKNCMVQADGSHECWAVERQSRYYVTEWGTIEGGEEAMMSEIFSRGPIGCALFSDDAFDYDYEGGVHTAQVTGNLTVADVNHDVEVTGWGVTNDGVKFWQARNSWGTFWGEQGFFKIQRGVNLNFIESECYFPVPEYGDESLLADGDLTGSLHGLVPKGDKASAEGVFFRQQLAKLDWTTLKTPPILLAADALRDGKRGGGNIGVGGGGGAGVGDGAITSSSPRLSKSSSEGVGALGAVGGRGWGEGVLVGVAVGVVGSVSVVAVAFAIKKVVRGDPPYVDISNGANSW
ncbi:unnamed protein product [Ectocarpus sp. 8 AP-2014]